MMTLTSLGILAATCTTLAFLPQTLRIFKTKQTKDLSLMSYVIYVIGLVAWLMYGIGIHDYVLMIGQSVALMLGLLIISFKIIYG
ncbi:MAG: SemiSWEET transporter [bacterium]